LKIWNRKMANRGDAGLGEVAKHLFGNSCW